MASPLVSIVMPMFNARPYLQEAIESVLSQEVPLELIIVDDGSTDGSVDEVVSRGDPRVKLLRNMGKGVSSAFNQGLAQARGEYFARCDSDDLFPRGRLSSQLRWLRANPQFDAVCGGFAVLDQRARLVKSLECDKPPVEITEELRHAIVRTHYCTWLAKTELVKSTGGCREFFRIAEDIDLQLRLGEAGRVMFLPEQWYLYRLRSGSLTHSTACKARAAYDGLAFQFSRQRAGGRPDDLQRGVAAAPEISDSKSLTRTSNEHIQDMLLGVAWEQFESGRRAKALKTGIKAILTQPFSLGAWRSFGALALRVQRT